MFEWAGKMPALSNSNAFVMTINKINVNGTEYDLDVLIDGSSISTAVSNTATVALSAYRGKVFIGSTSTAAETAAKAITVDDTLWELASGALLLVTSTNTNTAANATFSVNSGTAKSVKYSGAAIADPNLNKAGDSTAPQLYIYDGTNWVWLSGTSIGANRLNNTAKVGSSTKPVYFTANGVPSAIGYTISKSVPSNAVFTDDSVTSASNHYTPEADNNSELTAEISGTAGSYAKDTEYTVLTGVKAQRDAKGHVTGLTYTAQKVKDTNTTYSSLKNPNSIKINTDSTDVLSYDGSAEKTLTITGGTGKFTISDGTTSKDVTISGDTTVPSSSSTDTTIPTSKAVWSAISNGIAANDAMIYKGTIAGGSTGDYGALTAAANRGWTYKVSTAGKIDGVAVEVGDLIICNTDSTAAATSSTYSTIADKWNFVQANIDGAVTGPASSTDAHVAAFDGTTGKVIKDSGYTIGKSVPSNAVFTDTNTKVTSAANHYTPSADNNSELTATIDGTAGTYAKDTEYTVLTGVKAQRDAKGHVTGITYTAQKIKDTNSTYTVGSRALKVASNTGTATQAIGVNENSADRTLTISGDGTYITGAVSGTSNAAVVTLSHADAGTGSALTTSDGTASNYALNTEYTVLTGVTVSADAKGHITGVSTTRQKIKDTNTTYSAATQSANGLMSSTDKTKLDNITMSVTSGVLYLTTQATS